MVIVYTEKMSIREQYPHDRFAAGLNAEVHRGLTLDRIWSARPHRSVPESTQREQQGDEHRGWLIHRN
jgi:hypothetical protein